MSLKELRRHLREMLNAKVQLSWIDPIKGECYSVGRCRNVSQAGMQIGTKDSIAPRSFVTFRVPAPYFDGTGSVRYCRRVGIEWLVGLEFSRGLNWRLTAKPAEQPTAGQAPGNPEDRTG
jgi:hypothetical protein